MNTTLIYQVLVTLLTHNYIEGHAFILFIPYYKVFREEIKI